MTDTILYTIPTPVVNPDKVSIANKTVVDISVTSFDISASGYTTSSDIKLIANGTEIVIVDDITDNNFDKYYTPLYSEKINYNVWATTVDKNFYELIAN